MTAGTLVADAVQHSNGSTLDTSLLARTYKHAPWMIWGNTYAVGTDAVNDTNIAAGGCTDETGVYWMVCTALTKQLDAAWAVGDSQGGLDTGVIANADYYIWRIARSDTGVVDALYSLSSTAPTMPASYDFKRKVGWIKRVGATIVAYHTYETAGGGIEMLWDAPTVEISLANTLTTTRRTDAVKVPLNFSVIAHMNIRTLDASSAAATIVYCPDLPDIDPVGTSLYNVAVITTQTIGAGGQYSIRTSSAGLIAARSNLATVDSYQASTMGFTWARRN